MIEFVASKISSGFVSSKDRIIRSFVGAWMSTSVVMIFYVFFSWWVFPTATVAIGGAVFTLIHLLAPVVYRFSKSTNVAGLTVSLSGLGFQVLFSIYNGGIHSPCLVWLTVHPVILSFFGSRRLVIYSILINFFTLSTMFVMTKKGIFPENQLQADFSTTMFISSLFLLDVIVALYTLIFINQSKENESNLNQHNQFKVTLLRIISHDIKNAVFVSQGHGRILRKKIMNGENTEQDLFPIIDKLKMSSDIINTVCDRTMDWVASNELKISLRKEITPIKQIGEQLLHYFEFQCQAKNIKMLVGYHGLDDATVLVDSGVFTTQVLNNLVSNAIKFSKDDSVVEIHFKSSHDGSELLVEVIDKGVGLPVDLDFNAKDHPVFKTRRGTHHEPGTGLGLSITKSVLESMNATIHFESVSIDQDSQNHGTIVSVSLPIENAA